MKPSQLYPCPCCGYLVFDEPPGSYAICPICFWEDDLPQLRFVGMTGGANGVSLIEAQQNYARHRACEVRLVAHVRRPSAHEQQDPHWREVDPSVDPIEELKNIDNSRTQPDDLTRLYYWRRGLDQQP
jgi:hypothetical protein